MSIVAEIIRSEIVGAGGVIPFARFMDLALYHPRLGYYERSPGLTGRQGDFFTSVNVGCLFGELLAFQFAEWLSEDPEYLRQTPTLRLMESGAHEGRLAQDILLWFRTQRPALFEKLEYWIIEPSATRRGWQQETLGAFGARLRWAATAGTIPALAPFDGPSDRPLGGILFSNELFDAFPVHRFGWEATARAWFEWGVANSADDGGFAWARIPMEAGATNRVQPPPVSAELSPLLPDGYTIEVCPAAEQWWAGAARALRRGRLMTIDYGHRTSDLFRPGQDSGTLRAYQSHQVVMDVLAEPGEQDLTAHVNFHALKTAGESAGLVTETFQSQLVYLTRLAARTMEPGAGFTEWDHRQTRQFQTLTHPEHLGQNFSVLVQRRHG